jgi:CheY-like chemotaxis protein
MAEASAQGGAPRSTSGRPILFELARLAAVVVLPLLVVIALLLLDAARRDLAHATDEVRTVADETAARTERFLGDFRATLEAIAQRPLVRAMDAPNCDPALRTLRELYPRAGNILDGGQAGIDAFAAGQRRGERFDVVITDLGMPHIDGRRVAAAVKAASPSIPVVLLTGWGQRLVDEGDIPAHVDHVLNKPPKLRDLRAALSNFIPHSEER